MRATGELFRSSERRVDMATLISQQVNELLKQREPCAAQTNQAAGPPMNCAGWLHQEMGDRRSAVNRCGRIQ